VEAKLSQRRPLTLPFGHKESIAIASKQGSLFFLHYQTVLQPNAWQSGWYSHSIVDEQSFPMGNVNSSSRFGFDVLHQPPYFIPELKIDVPGKQGFITVWNSGVMLLKGSAIMIPYWFLTLTTGVVVAAPSATRRFSLRTLLIVTTLVAVLLGLIVYAVRS
jgi:hypothetical protein